MDTSDPKGLPDGCPFQKKHPSVLNRDDVYFMSMAYNQAIDAWRKNEVPVGAVITRENHVIASAYNQVESLKDPTAHAEVIAITKAAQAVGDWRLNECSLYVTKEPCPMCSGAAIMGRLERVIFGFSDSKMGCLGGAQSLHTVPSLNHRLLVTKGILERECLEMFQAFFQLKRIAGEQSPGAGGGALWN